MTEIETLAQLLNEDWAAVANDAVDGYTTAETINGHNRRWLRRVDVITRAPSGQHYRWHYQEGLTENQEDMGPCEFGDPRVDAVWPREKTTTVTEWVTTPPPPALRFARFVEFNEHEGENWTFWLQVNGNDSALAALRAAADDLCADDDVPQYKLLDDELVEEQVDFLIRYGGAGYMNYHNKITGRLVLPEELDDDFFADIYKGDITNFFKESE